MHNRFASRFAGASYAAIAATDGRDGPQHRTFREDSPSASP